ncbi:MAG: carboxypeptidase-like regulatory domain-containing protein, partial [Acidobacteriota bacterium]
MLHFRIAFSACICVCLGVAQTDRAILTGTVTDASGAAVGGALIAVTNSATNVNSATQSNSTGNFTVPALPVGAYRVRIEKPGFKAAVRTDLILSAGATATLNVSLELGQVTESIQVEATLDQLQTSTAKVSTAVANKMVDELPLVVGGAMRGAFDLALITPEANSPEDKGFNVGGAQGGSYGATLDGVSILTARFNSVEWANVNTPSVDAITEFAVETNGFKAEYGRAQGGMITFSSKSGTNELHGTAYEFLRNDALDARRFFEDE